MGIANFKTMQKANPSQSLHPILFLNFIMNKVIFRWGYLHRNLDRMKIVKYILTIILNYFMSSRLKD
jgi:hypothetical protein